MNSSSRVGAKCIGWLSRGERRVFAVQIAVIFCLISLLNLGFIHQRELREVAATHRLHTLVRSWDGFAWYAWVVAAPAMLVLIRRYPLSPTSLRRNLWRFGLGSAALYVVVTNTRYLLRVLPNAWRSDRTDLPMDWESYWHTLLVMLPLDFLTFIGFLATTFAIDYYHKHRQRADEVHRLHLEAERLRSELVNAKLATLRSQLQPHFLFNSFNAIAMLVRQRKLDPAVETITQLSGLLRMAIDYLDQPELRFRDEIKFVEYYLEIERIRFGGKLQTVIAVDPETLDCVVPSLLLQPLVENAIKHGISQRVLPGSVRIAAQRSGPRLEIRIVNDGPEPSSRSLAPSSGIGLANTRSRLRQMYDANFNLEMERIKDGGTAVRLSVPWREGTGTADRVRREAMEAVS